MAVTSVFKKDAVLYVIPTGSDEDVDDFKTVLYPDFKTKGTDLHIWNYGDTNYYNEESHIIIAIADVRKESEVAIGTQLKSEVRDYMAAELNK